MTIFSGALQDEGPFQETNIDGFSISYGFSHNNNRVELTIRDSENGYHKATHTNFALLDEKGFVIARPAITRKVAEFILRYFHVLGHTESFNIYAKDLKNNTLHSRDTSFEPENVRHIFGNAEKSFTATGNKLAAHWPIFHKLRDTGYGSIIRATMTNHQVCSSHCQFCSTIARNKSDRISLDEAKRFIETLYVDQARFNREHFPDFNKEYNQMHGCDIRLRGLILSGGGQPNLWPHFTEFVRWLSTLDIDLGLITNGFPPSIQEDIYECFRWVRISVTPSDASPFYPDGQFERQYIPASLIKNPKITVGYSYVDGPWADDKIYLRLDRSAVENGFEYVRTLVDCNLGRTAQLHAHYDLAERLNKIGLLDNDGKPKSLTFHQLKYHCSEEDTKSIWDNGQCLVQAYNVFWDTTGHDNNNCSYCYACDSVTVLQNDISSGFMDVSERKFNPSIWGTVTNNEVYRLFTEPLCSFFDPREVCRSCLFVRNNEAVKYLANLSNYDIRMPSGIKHLNFP